MKRILLIAVLILITGRLSAQVEINDNSEKRGVDDLTLLSSYMQGTFTSEEQSKNDTTYFNIVLRMKRIWTERTDGIWLYVEQAVATSEAKPYRQRVYRLLRTDDGAIESAVFTFPDAIKYAGEWKKDNPLETLAPADLMQRKNCSVFLTRNDDNTFSGSTRGKGCESELRNAKYATSEVVISSEGLTSWDRGYDEKDKQVWGAVKGGYVFKKVGD